MEGQSNMISKAGNQSHPSLLWTGPAITELPTSLKLKLVTLNFSVQQSSPLNANRTREQVTPIKDKDDLMKRYPDCFEAVKKFQGQYRIRSVGWFLSGWVLFRLKRTFNVNSVTQN